MKFLVNSLAASTGSVLGSQLSMRIGCLLQPRPMPHQFGALLDNPLRLRYRKPAETLGLYGFTSGMVVLDLGCGTGTFTVEMARMVGEQGTVHAMDLQRPLLDETRRRVEDAGLGRRVQCHHAGAEHIPLEDDSCDLAVLIATLPQIPDRYGALLELRRVLRPAARLAISEEALDPAYVPTWVTRHWLEDVGFILLGKTGSPFCYHMLFGNPK